MKVVGLVKSDNERAHRYTHEATITHTSDMV